MLKVWIDGACEPVNPNGTASYGVVVQRDNEIILKFSRVVGSGEGMSNNVAEYSALLAFLGWYTTNANREEAIVHSDSQLVVNQMNGNWKARAGLYWSYYNTAKNIMKSPEYSNISFKWIPI